MGDENNKISITYETIFELLRREKNRDELQKLNETFYEDVKSYIEEKNKTLQSDASLTDFDHEKLSKQIQNTKRMIIELFERREKKILIMALNKVRTSSAIVDTSSFLPQEKKFFHDSINLFIIYRNDLFETILSDKKIHSSHVVYESPRKKEELPIKKHEFVEPQKQETNLVQNAAKQPSIPVEATPKNDAPKKPKNTKMIRVLAHIPKFVGKELEMYGPFNPDDMANIPDEIANILIKKGRAEEVKID